jgi:hypothetical protein
MRTDLGDQPLSVSREPLHGWRSWSVGGDHLVSPHYALEWPHSGARGECPHEEIPVHERECPCGINAFKHPWQILLASHYHERGSLIGEVELTGQVRIFARGYRSELARPTRLWALDRTGMKIGDAIAERYGASFEGMAHGGDDLWRPPAVARIKMVVLRGWLAALCVVLLALTFASIGGPYTGSSEWQRSAGAFLFAVALSGVVHVPTRSYRRQLGMMGLAGRATLAGLLVAATCLALATNVKARAADRTHRVSPERVIQAMQGYEGTVISYDLPEGPLAKLRVREGERYELPATDEMIGYLGLGGKGTPCTARSGQMWCHEASELRVGPAKNGAMAIGMDGSSISVVATTEAR